ncbi:unnamed protein product [Closterium sp. Yama58-4]|nr:unnamed protein product [Closterium sp. Yama58-4]
MALLIMALLIMALLIMALLIMALLIMALLIMTLLIMALLIMALLIMALLIMALLIMAILIMALLTMALLNMALLIMALLIMALLIMALLIMDLLIGAVFFGFGRTCDTPQQIVNVTGALCTTALFLGWSNIATIQPIIAMERSIYYRERGAGMFVAIPYALAQGVIELPYLAVQARIYASITYLLIRFEWMPGKFLWYLLFQFFTLLYFTCFGMMASAITPTEGLGTLLSAFVYSIWNLLWGFLLPQLEIRVYWKWLYWVNPVAWSLYGISVSQLGNVTTLVVSPPGMLAQTVSQFIQLYYGFSHECLDYATAALLAFSCLFFCVFTYALRNLNFQWR